MLDNPALKSEGPIQINVHLEYSFQSQCENSTAGSGYVGLLLKNLVTLGRSVSSVVDISRPFHRVRICLDLER